MNKVKYFYEEVTVKEALSEEGSDTEDFSRPENVPGGLRMTMEELAYRTAVWYDPNGKAVMYYQMTTSGIKTRGIRDEDRERSDIVERLPLPGEEPRLLG